MKSSGRESEATRCFGVATVGGRRRSGQHGETFLLEATPGAQEIDAARPFVYLPLIVGLRYREMNVRVCPSGKVTATR